MKKVLAIALSLMIGLIVLSPALGQQQVKLSRIDAALEGEGQYTGKAYFFGGDQYVRYDWAMDKVDEGPVSIIAGWKLPAGFEDGIDAAINGEGPFSGKAYFFKGDQYVRYDWATDKVDEGPVSIAAGWKLPAGFSDGIDAAINGEGPFSGKAYFFKGDQYVRYDWATDEVDDGPVGIADWNLPEGFSDGIDSAINGEGPFSGKAYFFKGDHYVRYDWATDKVDEGYPDPIPISGNWDGLTIKLQIKLSKIDAALEGQGQYVGKAFFFGGDQYVRYDWATDRVDLGYPDSIAAAWILPAGFEDGIDAAINGEGPFSGKYYFFKGDQYVRYDWMSYQGSRRPIFKNSIDEGPVSIWATDKFDKGPVSIAAWNFPAGFSDGIDAAINGEGPFSGKAYFFKGNQYIRYDWATDKVDEGPVSIAAWNFPAGFSDGIDAAINGEGPFSGKAYFFKGDQYVRYDWATDKVDEGYPDPIPISGNWDGLQVTNDNGSNPVGNEPSTGSNPVENPPSMTCSNADYDTPATQLSQEAAETAVLCLINEQRIANGVPALKFNQQLRDAARLQANDAKTIKWWEGGGSKIHTNPLTGSTPQSRIKDAGYCPGEVAPPTNENGYDAYYRGGVEYQGGTTPRAAVTWWMNSQGHRNTLLNPIYTESGVGVVLGVAEQGNEADQADGGAIFVQTFGGCTAS